MSDSRSTPPQSARSNGPAAWIIVVLVGLLLLFGAWRFLKGLEASVGSGDWDSVVHELKICAALFGSLLAATSVWLANILRRAGAAAIAEQRYPPSNDPGLHSKDMLLGAAAIARGRQLRRLATMIGAVGVAVALLGAGLVLRL